VASPLREAETFLETHPEVRAVDLLIGDTNGILRGKRIERSVLPKAYIDGIALPGSVFGADITGDTVEETGLGFSIGDADQLCRPIPGSLKPVPWAERPGGQLLMSMYTLDGQPFMADPRHILAGVLERFRADGLNPVVAVEMEFYLIDGKRGHWDAPQPPISPVSGEREHKTQVYGMSELDDYSALLEEVAATCEAQGIPADTAVAEYAPGQYEVNLHHEADVLSACDHALLLKRVIKNVALRHGMEATFMAKPYPDMAGSGTHLHVSLLDGDGRNVFANGRDLGSETLHHAIGGLTVTMAESMAVLAPNANSYRRFRPDNFVPLAPHWGFNNRTTALRIPTGPDSSRRIEHRVAGADANPYLLAAVVLAGMHHGISGRLAAPPPSEGDACTRHEPALPLTWGTALERLAASEVLRDYLGETFMRVYLANRSAERDKFRAQTSPLEYQWYLASV
jgi:glutamine synthetase